MGIDCPLKDDECSDLCDDGWLLIQRFLTYYIYGYNDYIKYISTANVRLTQICFPEVNIEQELKKYFDDSYVKYLMGKQVNPNQLIELSNFKISLNRRYSKRFYD